MERPVHHFGNTIFVNYTIKMDKPRSRATVVNVNRLKKCFVNPLFPQDALASDSEDAVVIRPGRKPRSKKQTNKNAAPAETTSTAAQNEEAADVNRQS